MEDVCAGYTDMPPFCFGDKHRDYMRRAMECTVNIAEGAVRAGKTVDNVFVFAALLEDAPDRLHLATGATIGNAKLNLGDCNGLGLERIFRGRCAWGRYKDNECLRIQTKSGEKAVIFAGGNKYPPAKPGVLHLPGIALFYLQGLKGAYTATACERQFTCYP